MDLETDNTDNRKANKKLLAMLVGMVFFMVGFSFAMVPLYDIFCELTGLNGKTAPGPAAGATRRVDESRTVKVQFVANNSAGGFRFRPELFEMRVRPGELTETRFHAQNTTDYRQTAQAVPSVAPGQAALHFHKTECFCFDNQVFEARAAKAMPVRFVVDPALPEAIKTITLSYTFFQVDRVTANSLTLTGK